MYWCQPETVKCDTLVCYLLHCLSETQSTSDNDNKWWRVKILHGTASEQTLSPARCLAVSLSKPHTSIANMFLA